LNWLLCFKLSSLTINNYVEMVFRPLALLLAISCLPVLVAIRALKPCLLFLTKLLG